jgi:hypothetical protein
VLGHDTLLLLEKRHGISLIRVGRSDIKHHIRFPVEKVKRRDLMTHSFFLKLLA